VQTFRCFLPAVAVVVLAAIAPRATQAQDLNIDILHTFTSVPDGAGPVATVIRDADGNLYGTTSAGGDGHCPGTNGAGCGTVYEISKNGRYTILHKFTGGNGDGAFPVSGVTRDAAGNLFGTTEGGNGNLSTIYKITKTGSEKTLRFLTNFTGGADANSAPILDAKGNLFGNTQYGGDSSCGFNGNGCGVIYEVQATGAFSVLYTFVSLTEGIEPIGSPVIDSKGNLFGTTQWGGDLNCEQTVGCGTVYELDHTGKYKTLHKFTGKSDGSFPGCVIDDGGGNLVGVTGAGGDLSCSPPFGCGTIFRIDKAGNLKTLYEFTPFTENNNEHGCLVRDSKGNLYGTNANGGTHNAGYLAVLDTADKYSVLYNFPIANSSQGGVPLGVVLGPDGEFFGVNGEGGDTNCGVENSGCGTVFKLAP
jgi:uncharacterized repeat protein (TIGR03803 family)